MEYTVVARTNIVSLTKTVMGMIKIGWKPYGSIAVAQSHTGDNLFVQPMIRHTSKEEKDESFIGLNPIP